MRRCACMIRSVSTYSHAFSVSAEAWVVFLTRVRPSTIHAVSPLYSGEIHNGRPSRITRTQHPVYIEVVPARAIRGLTGSGWTVGQPIAARHSHPTNALGAA